MPEVFHTPKQTVQQQDSIDEIFLRQQRHQYVVARSTARERIAKLRRLHDAMLRHQEAIRTAMFSDFRKPAHEVIFRKRSPLTARSATPSVVCPPGWPHAT